VAAGRRRGQGDHAAPKSLTRWLRLTLLLGGIRGRLPLADAIALAMMLVRTGRAVPPGEWVETQAEDADEVLAAFGPV
jgi:hypothetical protein